MAEFDEAAWWGDCANTFHEEEKQLVYAGYMGLVPDPAFGGHPPSFNLEGRNVVDIGGGPTSLLLKCVNRGPRCHVIDPTLYPSWVAYRYADVGIRYSRKRGEDFTRLIEGYDEAWTYNVLQHVDDPCKVAANMRMAAPVVRVFDWIDIPPYPGHEHELTERSLDRWFCANGHGKVVEVEERGAVGRAWAYRE